MKESDPDLVDIAILYEEVLIENKVHFIPKIEAISKLNNKFGHKEINAKGSSIKFTENSELIIGNEIDFVMINNDKISLKA